jgi:hypothetical protein
MGPMPSPGNVLSAAGVVCFQQKSRPRRGCACQQRDVNRGNDPTPDNARNPFPGLRYPTDAAPSTLPNRGENRRNPNGLD